jgi:cell wall integrity and stress response component
MKSVIFLAAALLAAADAMPEMANFKLVKLAHKLASRGTQKPKTAAAINQQTSQGCFKSSGDLKFISTPQYNSLGGCALEVCNAGGYSVAGTTGGNQCWCGSSYPRKSDLVDDSECNVDCSGYPEESCE